jgi:signal transduction histidine kinase
VSEALQRGLGGRGAFPVLGHVADGGRLAGTLLGGVLSAWIISEVVSRTDEAFALGSVADVLSVVATALFFGAAVLRLTHWALTGDTSGAVSGASLLVFAVVTFPLALASRALGDGLPATVWSGSARLVATITVVVVLAAALRASTLEPALRPGRRAAAGITASVVAFVLLVLVHRQWVGTGLGSPALGVAIQLAIGAIWCAAAWLYPRGAARQGTPAPEWSAGALLLLAVAAAFRAETAWTSAAGWLVGAAYLTALAGAVVLINGGVILRTALAARGEELRSTSGALADAQRVLGAVERRQAEVVHDSRSMIAALRAASWTLEGRQGPVDDDSRIRLRTAMDAELGRLGRLIDAPAAAPLVEFDLAGALEPVISTAAAEGLLVRADLGRLCGFGRPDDLAEAVQNLLVNARRHAPGSPVTVRSEAAGQVVRVVVEDRGPGVDRRVRASLFERGVRAGRSADGSGLGLAAVSRLMREQDGDVTALDRVGGGACFVLTLPRAPSDRGLARHLGLVVDLRGETAGADAHPLAGRPSHHDPAADPR